MLLYHFGSRDGLMLAVAQRVEARTRGAVVADGSPEWLHGGDR